MSLFGKILENVKWHYETKRTRMIWGWRLGYLGHGCIIDRGVRIKGAQRIRIGDNSRLCVGCSILAAAKNDYVTIGDKCNISRFACLDAAGGYVTLGDNVFVGVNTSVGGHGGCSIGNDCQIAAFCYIIAANHIFDDPNTLIRLQGYDKRGIKIDEDCWLGNGVSVLDGVNVGRGSVLAAHCVVTKDVEPYSVMAGIPAKFLRERGTKP